MLWLESTIQIFIQLCSKEDSFYTLYLLLTREEASGILLEPFFLVNATVPPGHLCLSNQNLIIISSPNFSYLYQYFCTDQNGDNFGRYPIK